MNTKIIVCYHKQFKEFANEVLLPLHVGAQNSSNSIANMQRDDTGMLIALLLFAAAFLLAAVLGRSLRHTLPLTVTGAALAVYGCTWLNHKSGAYPLLGLALAVLAVLAVRQARQKRLALPPAGQALLLLGLILLLWAATRDWVPAFVDDRRHWAVFAAQMVTVERFPTGLQSCSSFADYPPLTGLFQAFLQPGRRTADIGLFYFGQRLFYMVL